jgi:long-subunit fatty acid transport protein
MTVRATRSTAALFAGLALCPRVAAAGGLDLPIVYSARQAGMGGTAIAEVSDASAVLHNPAGLVGVHGLNLLADATVVLTDLETSPAFANQNVQTGNAVAAAPFLAAAYRPLDRLAFGLGAYAVGAVSGTFHYLDANGQPTLNSQNTVVFEVSPAVSYAPTDTLRLGAGYRITLIQFDRHLGPAQNPVLVDIDSFGANFAGFRFGAQWHPFGGLWLGAVFRPEVGMSSSAGSGHLLGQAATNIQAQVTYPAKLGVGARYDLAAVSFAADYELVFNSQFKTINLSGDLPHGTISAPFLFNWSDSSTFKIGAEVRPAAEWVIRGGYAFDGVFSNAGYPDTFAQPPVAGHYLTIGGGYRGNGWEVNVALAYRPDASAVITASQIASPMECPFCAHAGTYGSRLDMAMVDFSKDFNL